MKYIHVLNKILINIILFSILITEENILKDILADNSFEFYYSKYICDFLILDSEKKCESELLNDYNIFYKVKAIKSNINLIIDINKSKIENIFLLVGLIPLLKNNSTIQYKINTKEVRNLFEIIFNYKEINTGKIIIDIKDFERIKTRFGDLINYRWEILPKKEILDNLRFIINNYYDDICSRIFDISLNKNYEYYIQTNSILLRDSYEKFISKLA